MKICFTETALDEVDDILSYIAQYNPSAAVKVAAAVRQAVARAAARPKSSPIVYASARRGRKMTGG